MATLATRYLTLGVLAGLLAPAALFAYVVIAGRSFGALELFGITALGSMITVGLSGWMIGRRDDALRRRNQELGRLTEQLKALSATDPLTAISNRRTFDERLTVEVARADRYGTPLALVMLDLDRFKELNDRLGHPAGDEVLRQVGAILDREKRVGDVVARFGGEEFAAVLPHTDARAAGAWAERVRQLIAGIQLPGEHPSPLITASFGVAESGARQSAPAELVEDADHALYQAKHQGRNQVVEAAAVVPRSCAV